MVFGNFESPSANNRKEEQSDNQAESRSVEGYTEGELEKEQAVGKNAEKYKASDNIAHNTFPIRDQLDTETVKKLEKLKAAKEQAAEDDDEDNNTENVKKAA